MLALEPKILGLRENFADKLCLYHILLLRKDSLGLFPVADWLWIAFRLILWLKTQINLVRSSIVCFSILISFINRYLRFDRSGSNFNRWH